jgi:hypothetical protein
MEELVPGCRARIHGLVSAIEHNGKKGVLILFIKETQMWWVDVGDLKLLALKPENLVFLKAPDYTDRRHESDVEVREELSDEDKLLWSTYPSYGEVDPDPRFQFVPADGGRRVNLSTCSV